MNGKTSTNLGKQQIKSLSELNQYNMEPTITDNRTVAKGRSSFIARCTVACFSMLAFLLIGNSQIMAQQCGLSGIPDPLSVTLQFPLDGDCEAVAVNPGAVAPVYGTLGDADCDFLIWYTSNDPTTVRGGVGNELTSGIFTGADITGPTTYWIALSKSLAVDPNDPTVRSSLNPVSINVVDTISPTLDILNSPVTIQCADLASDDPEPDELAELALLAGLDLQAEDNCGIIADTIYTEVSVASFCDGSGIVRVYTISVVVIDAEGNVSAADEFVVEVEDAVSTPDVTVENDGVTINCEDEAPAPVFDTAFVAGACVFASVDDIEIVRIDSVSTQDPDETECGHYSYTITQTYTATYLCNNNPQVGIIEFVINVEDIEPPVVDSTLLEDAVTFTITGDSTNVDSSTATLTAQANNVNADTADCLACIEIDLAVEGFITDNCADFENLLILYSRAFVGGDSLGYPDPDTLKQRGEEVAIVDTCYAIGISTVAFTIVDACLNATEYVITIEVLDLDFPIIEGCPANMVVDALEGECSRIVEWVPPTALDCSEYTDSLWAVGPGGQELIILGPNGVGEWYAEFSVGINTVYHEFIDEFGNADTCIFTVEVVDTQAPEVVAEDTITVQLDADGMATIVESDFIISIDDNCQALAPTVFAPSSFTCADLGENDVTVTVSDTSENDTTFIVVVIVEDNVAPFLVEGEDVVVNYTGDCGDEAGDCTVDIEIPTPEFADNCDVVSLLNDYTDTDDASGVYPVGVTLVTWTATDPSDNTTQFVQQVMVLDLEAPQFVTFPEDIEVLLSVANSTGCNAIVDWIEPDVTDCTDPVVVVSTEANGDLFELGVSTVTYTAFDQFGNSCSRSFTVTVVDDVDPTLACQTTPFIIQSICDDIPLPDLVPLVNASDNCSGPLTYTQYPEAGTPMDEVFDMLNLGDIEDGAEATITITVTDASDNSTSCEITIVLQDLGLPVPALAELDSVTPYTVPDNVLPTASCGSVAIPAPEAFDCQANVIYGVPPSFPNVQVIPGTPPVYIFPAQNNYNGFDSTYYAVQWTYTNPVSGLSASQLQIVIVISDVEPPVLTAPASIVVGTSADAPPFDNCEVVLTAGTVEDMDGNPVDIRMNHGTFPNLLPIPIPAEGFVNDNCEVDSMWYVMTTPSGAIIEDGTNGDYLDAGDQIFDELNLIGVYTITYYAMDGSGNIGQSAPFTVTVVDDQDPEVLACPTDIAFPVDASGCSYTIGDVSELTPDFNDNCVLADTFWTITPIEALGYAGSVNGADNGDAVSGNGTLMGVTFDITGSPAGTADFLVEFYVTDESGNPSEVCDFIITINDDTDPIIACVDGGEEVANSHEDETDPCVWIADTSYDPDFSDNCDVDIASSYYMIGEVVTLGTLSIEGVAFPINDPADETDSTCVTFVVFDNAGNSAECVTCIRVVDATPPTWDYVWNINGLTCGETLDLYVTDTDCEVFFEWMRPGNQNVDDCTAFSITEDITESIANFNAQFNVNQIYGVYDQNNPNLVSVNLPHGLTTFTYVATDAFGNTAVCEFYVNVIDNVPPVVTCPSNSTVGVCDTFRVPTYTFQNVVENCPYTITQIPAPGTMLSEIPGLVIADGEFFVVTLIATDLQGNSASCSFDVYLDDNEFPVPSNGVAGGFLADITPETFAGASCGTITIPAPVSNTCDQTIYGLPSQSNGFAGLIDGVPHWTYTSATFAPGQTITWTYTNTNNGNSVQQLQFIQVIDDVLEPTVNVFFDGLDNFILGTADDGGYDCTVTPSNGIDDAFRDWTVVAVDTANELPVPNPSLGSAVDNCGVVALWYTVEHDGEIETSDTSAVSVNPAEYTYQLGVSTVTVYAEDAAGNVGSASFTVTVVDDESPEFVSCPINNINGYAYQYAVDGNCEATSGEIIVVAEDNCPGIITYEVYISSLEPGALVNGEVDVLDTILSATGVDLSGYTFNVASTASSEAIYTVEVYATDANGNGGYYALQPAFDPCAFNIRVYDNTAPTIDCVAEDVSFIADQDVCGYTIVGSDEFASLTFAADNCTSVDDLVIEWVVYLDGDVFASGENTLDGLFLPLADLSGSTTYQVVWTATDNAGNTSDECTTNITIYDNLEPEWLIADQTFNLQANQTDCEAFAFWTRPTFADVNDCSDFNITESISNPMVENNVEALFGEYDAATGGVVQALMPVGTTTVTYVATDVNNNVSVLLVYTFNVEDVTAPTIVCEGPQMIPSICPLVEVPDYTGLGTVNDNCSNYTVTQDPAPGTLLSDVGVNLVNGATFNVTLTVTDNNNGLTADCSFTVTLLNNDAPVPTVEVLPTIDPINTLAAGCAPFELPRPTATTCFSGTVVGVTTVTSPNVLTANSIIFNLPGTYVLVWSYIDGVNVSQQTQVVTVSEDVIAPSVVCLDDITVDTDPGSCNAVVNILLEEVALTATTLAEYNAQVAGLELGQYIDNCGGVSYTYTITNGGDVVYENASPVITETITEVSPEINQSTFSDMINTAPTTNNFDNHAQAITAPNFVGQAQVVVHVSGNSSAGSWRNEYRVQILAPDGQNVTQGAPGGEANEWQPSSLSSGGSFTGTYNAGVFNNVGGDWTIRTRNTWGSGSQNVNVTLEIIPLIEFQAAVIDTVTGDFVTLPVGENTVTYTLSDGEGNTSTCSYTVTVEDNEAPMFADCPAGSGDADFAVGQLPAQVRSTGGVCGPTPAQLANVCDCPTGYVAVGFSGTAGTAWGGNVLSSFVLHCRQILADGTFGPLTDVTCSNGTAVGPNTPAPQMAPAGHALVGSQNALGCALDRVVGRSKPISDVLANSPNTANSTMPNFGGTGGGLQALQLVPNGSVVIGMQTYIDPSNQNIVAGVAWRHANLAEIVAAAATIVVDTDPGVCFATKLVQVPAVSDNCEVESYTVEITDENGGIVYSGDVDDLPATIEWPLGLNEVVFTATDASGNSSTCSYAVLVNDTERPEIECPANIVVENDLGVCGAVVVFDAPEVSDNCPGDLTVQQFQGLPSGSTFPVGTTTNIFIVTDASGNTQVCSFTVTVNDTEAPEFVNYLCGQTIQVDNLEGDCFNNVQWTRPGFGNLSDNCTAPQNLIITEEVVDNPTVVIIPSGFVPGGNAFASFPVGITTIRYTLTDEFGNMSECFVNIEVIDTEAPTITCPGSFTFPSVCPDEMFIDLTSLAVVDDNCDNYTVTQYPGDDMTLSQILGGASNVVVGAPIVVTFTVTDSYGNSNVCQTTVTLQNIQSPIPTVGVDGGVLPALTPTTDIATTCSPYLVHAPTATANCGADIIIATLSAGGAGVTPIGDFPFESYWFEAGNYTITWVYNDGNTNTPNASQVQVIQVTNDNIAPKVTCPANVVVSAQEGLCSYTGVAGIGMSNVSFPSLPPFNAFTPAPGQYADNCGATVQYSLSGATTVALTNGTNAGVQTFNVGVTTVTYVATDAAGNSVSCSFTVTVTDDEAPIFAACPIVEPEPEPESFSVTISTAALGFPNTFAANPTYAFTVPASIMGDYNLTVSADGEVFGGSWRNEFRVQIFSPSGVNITQGAPGGLADEWSPSGEAFGGPLVGMHNFGTFVDPAGDWTVFVRLSFDEGPQINANVDLTFDFTPAEEAPELGGGNGTICAEAIELPSGPSMVNGSTTGNPLSGLPTCVTTLNSAAASWYVLEGVVGEVVINTFGSPFDTKLGVFSGSCGNLTCVTGNDDFGGLQSQVTFNAVEGTSYYVIVTGFGTAAGNYTLTTQATASGPVIPEADIVVNTDPGQCYATAPVEVLDVTDNCSVVSFTVVVENDESGVVYSGNVSNLPASLQWPLGLNNVTFTATDAAGNSATCGYSVAVIDEEAPVIACPELEEIEVGPSFQATVESANPIPPAGFYNIFYPVEVPASLTGLYSVTVSYNGTSGAFSWRNEYFSMIIGPDGETYFNAQPTPEPFTGPIVGTFNLGLVSNPAGTWQVWAGDAFGDFTFDVDVTLSFEPVAFPDALAVLNTNDDGFGDCSTSYTWNHPAASDNCDFEYTVSYFNPDGSTEGPFVVMSGASATRVFDQGTTAVIYTATDISGNSTTCEFSIVVVDNEPPTAICDPISITLNPEGIAIVTPSVIENNINDGSYDNCPGQLTYWLDQVMFTCADLGVNPIRLYVMDATGNISICNTTITVLDNNLAANPVWPDDVTITNCQDPQNLSLTGMVTGDSPCGNAGTYVDVIIPGNCPGNYVIQRNWTVLDAAGIPSTHTQIITVVDNQGPIFSGVPSNITLTSCEGLAALIATPGNVQAVDCPGNTSTLPITYTTAISACSAGSYTITRTWVATDACGNSSTATQVITVLDNQAPVITGPTEITLNVSDYDVTTCVSSVDLIVTVTDCNLAGPTVVTNSFNAGGANASDIYPVGTTTVVFTATDACGNSSTHTAVVTVVDDVNPVAICFESFNVVLNNQGIGTIYPWELDNGSYDNCENITMFLNEVGMTSLTFTCEDLGPQAVTLVVQDDAGNLNECVTIVNVMANSADQLEVTVVTTDVTAVGGNDGTATAVVTGGSGNYAYWWSNGGTTQTITGLTAGVYSVTVSDLNPANCSTAEGSGVVMGGAPITFHVGSAAGAVGDIVEVPVSVENFANILGFQFTIDVVDPSIGQIVGFNNFGLPGLTAADFNPATGTVSWVNNLPQAVTLADGTVIFHIQVQLVGGMTGSSSDVVITSDPLALEVIQEQGGLAVQIAAADVVTTDGEVVVTQGLSGPFAIGGNIITEDGLPVALVDVDMTGDVMESMTTTTNGTYFFDEIPLGSDVSVTPSKDVNHLNGITTFDAVLLQRHLIGTQILGSPYKKIAADIDADGQLTVLDLIQLRRVILLIDNDFINPFTGLKNNTSWRFALPGLTDPNPASMSVPAYTEARDYMNLSADFIADHYIGIKIGDLNNSVSPNALAPETGDNAHPANYRSTLAMVVNDVDYKAGETFTVDFMAKDFIDVAGYQFTFNFDAAQLNFAGVEAGDLRNLSADNFGLTFVEEGAVTVSWNDIDADLQNDAILFSITFEAIANGTLSNAIEITSELIRVEGYRSNGEFMDITIQYTGGIAARGEFILYQNEPNPFVSETRIGFELPEAANATLSIFDGTGRLLRSYPGEFVQGYNVISVERGDLPVSGVLYYQLSTSTHSATKKMILAQ